MHGAQVAASGRDGFFEDVRFTLTFRRTPDGNDVLTIEPLSDKVRVEIKRDKRRGKA